MEELDCPYLHCETTAYRRVGLKLNDPGVACVSRVWFCRHPFHGVTLELGDAWLDVVAHCKVCGLPREQAGGDQADDAAAQTDDAGAAHGD